MVEFAYGLSGEVGLVLIPYSCYINILLNSWPRYSPPRSYVISTGHGCWTIHIAPTKFVIVIAFLSSHSVTYLRADPLKSVQYKYWRITASVLSSPEWRRYMWYHFTTYCWSNCGLTILSLNVTSFIAFLPQRKEPFLYSAHVIFPLEGGLTTDSSLWDWNIEETCHLEVHRCRRVPELFLLNMLTHV